jgi:hypothetical protein
MLVPDFASSKITANHFAEDFSTLAFPLPLMTPSLSRRLSSPPALCASVRLGCACESGRGISVK